jgi:cyclophilin family peptidyl-prolyl cis-trans isomerase
MRQICLYFVAAMMSLSGLCFSLTSEENKKMTTTPKTKHPVVLIKTTAGDIKVELDADKAPISVKNFLQYVNEGHYDGTIFHRVIEGFMVQGGGFTKDMQQKPVHAPIKIESDNGLKNTRGTLAMARTSDPNSATGQFFINVVDNKFLDFTSKSPSGYGYAVFGRVTEGMDVVDKIRKMKTGNKGAFSDVPVESIEIIEAKEIK